VAAIKHQLIQLEREIENEIKGFVNEEDFQKLNDMMGEVFHYPKGFHYLKENVALYLIFFICRCFV
jgi:hypothetical protein